MSKVQEELEGKSNKPDSSHFFDQTDLKTKLNWLQCASLSEQIDNFAVLQDYGITLTHDADAEN